MLNPTIVSEYGRDMDPAISNTSEARFLFGTFDVTDGTPVFKGAIVHGSGLTYDANTHLPTGGVVERIVVQTRSTDTVLETHATYENIDLNVAELNDTFMNADAPWFDATSFFAPPLDQDSPDSIVTTTYISALDLTDDVDPEQISEFLSAPCDMNFETGDVLTAKDLIKIYSAKPKPPAPRGVDLGVAGIDDDITTLLRQAHHATSKTDFKDFYIEGLETDRL